METFVIPCGFLKVKALEMIRPWSEQGISMHYPLDENGMMLLAMNALLVHYPEEGRVILIDPGMGTFLPENLKEEYGLEIPSTLEEELGKTGLGAEDITDVIFTHLHFDHGTAAFKNVDGKPVRLFPSARYHILKEHFQYAGNPDMIETSSYYMEAFESLDEIRWLEDWDSEWMRFEIYHGHTHAMILPVINTGDGLLFYLTDLVPMQVFMEKEVYSSYDLDPARAREEKNAFLSVLEPGSRLVFYHDPVCPLTNYP